MISSIEDLKKFNIILDDVVYDYLTDVWPGPVSVILPCKNKKLKYLHRGKNKLAFRVPRTRILRYILTKIGPLVAPSANLQGQKPAETIREVKSYFGESCDFFSGAGHRIFGKASKIVEVKSNRVEVLRK